MDVAASVEADREDRIHFHSSAVGSHRLMALGGLVEVHLVQKERGYQGPGACRSSSVQAWVRVRCQVGNRAALGHWDPKTFEVLLGLQPQQAQVLAGVCSGL